MAVVELLRLSWRVAALSQADKQLHTAYSSQPRYDRHTGLTHTAKGQAPCENRTMNMHAVTRQ